MKDDLHKDNLENFFHNALDDFGDMPPDDFWDKLEPKIPAKPGGKIAFLGSWRSVAAGGALLLLNWKTAAAAVAIVALSMTTYQWLDYQDKFDVMAQELKEQRDEMKRLKEDMKTRQADENVNAIVEKGQMSQSNGEEHIVDNGLATNDEVNKSFYVREDEGNKGTKILEQENKTQAKTITKNPSNSIANNRSNGVNISTFHPSTSTANGENKNNSINSSINHSPNIASSVENNYNTTNNSPNLVSSGIDEGRSKGIMASGLDDFEQRKRITALSFLDSRGHDVLDLNANTPLVMSEFGVVKSDNKIARKNWRLGFYASPVYGHRKVKAKKHLGANQDSIPFKRHYEKPQISRELGVDIAYQVSKNWYIKGGVNYTRTKHESKEARTLTYLSSNEELSGGGDDVYSSRYVYSLPTSYGDNDMDIVLNRPEGVTIEDGEELELMVHSELFFEKISVPVTLGYHIQKGRLGIRVEGGLAPGKLVRNGIAISEFKTKRDDLFIDKAEVSKRFKDINTGSLEAVGSAELAFAVTDNVELTLAPTVKVGMQPIYQNDAFKSNPYDASLRLGMAYTF